MPRTGPVTVLVNPSASSASGRGQIDRELSDLFRGCGCDATIVVVPSAGDLPRAARHAAAHASVVVAAGGDGTINSVAGGIIDSGATLGILPLGTLNHFAKDLGIPLGLPEAVAVVAGGHRRRVDVGQANDRVFVNNCSIGMYPDIVRERAALVARDGRSKGMAMAIATLRVLRRDRGITVRLNVNGRQHTRHTPFVLIGNNEYVVEGARLGTRRRIDQGLLVAYLAPRARVRDLPMLFAQALIGRARESGAFEIVPATELIIDTRTTKLLDVAVDGEVARMMTPITYRIRAGTLQVLVPRA